MRKTFAAFMLLFGGVAFAQTSRSIVQPDCVIDFSLNGTTSTIAGGPGTCGANTSGVIQWRIAYKSTGFTGVTLAVQSAPDNSGVPGAWVTFAGTVVEGINPNTSTTQASTNLSGFYPWVRVNLTGSVGTGLITGVLYGCREPGCAASLNVSATIAGIIDVQGPVPAGTPQTGQPLPGGGTDTSGNAQPIKLDTSGRQQVVGAAAAGSPPAGAPVPAAGTDGTNIRTILTDSNGRPVVVGGAASGAVQAGNPVPIAGNDGTDVRTIATDTSGQQIPSNTSTAGADGVSNTTSGPAGAGGASLYYRVLPLVFNSSTNDRQFACTNQAPVTITAATDTVLVAGVASTNIRVCHLDFSTDTIATFTIRQGTGATCGTSTATVAGAYPNVSTFAMDYQPTAALRTTVTARDLCLHASTSVTAGGVIVYAQF